MAKDSDWYVRIEEQGKKRAKWFTSDGSWYQSIKMNHEGGSVVALELEGIRRDDGTLQLTLITPDDKRYEIAVTTPRKEEDAVPQ